MSDLNDWGIKFIREIDQKVVESGDQTLIACWKEGDWVECEEWVNKTFPELTEDQLEWIEDFLSEI